RVQIHGTRRSRSSNHARGVRMEPRSSYSQPGAFGNRILGFGYWNWNSARKTTVDFRSLPASRWNHEPQIWRHGFGSFHQPRNYAAFGRGNSPAKHSRPRKYL